VKSNVVLDTGVLTLFFLRDDRVFTYFKKISDGETNGLISGINLGEFYYKTCQKLGRQTADTRFNLILDTNIVIVEDAELNRLAGLEKCRREHDLSFADCYALALTKRVRGILLTTDSELAKSREVETRHFLVA